MDFSELVRTSRSYRRFKQKKRISLETLRSLVELTRYAPSGANKQPVKYFLASTEAECEQVFPYLAWAGYLESWKGPEEGQRPAAYIVTLQDTDIANDGGLDPGIFAQTILLGAAERGIGGCMFGAIRRDGLRKACSIPGKFEILNVLALGYPDETIVIEDVGADGNIRYYRDNADVHHVPKRTLDELIVNP
jgi:nitroreductase